MSLSIDAKEDLRLQMADLERKLAESEEERSNLEKTCNVLIRAFREEERIHYKSLNEKYEKFLENCALRKRRNEIILRSLSRIEDRSRALFAKTERIKLLKDRYVSHLKINEYVKKDEAYTQFSRSVPFSSTSHTNDVRWSETLKKFQPTQTIEFKELRENIFYRNSSPISNFRPLIDPSPKLEDISRSETRMLNGTLNTPNFVKITSAQNELKPFETDCYVTADLQAESDSSQLKGEKLAPNQLKSEKHVLNDKLRTGIMPLQEHQDEPIEKLRKALLFEEEKHLKYGKSSSEESHDPYGTGEDAEGKSNEAVFQNEHFVAFNLNVAISDKGGEEEEKSEGGERTQKETDVGPKIAPKTEHQDKDSPRNSKPLPMGLDGVDYQNETYPESYYEQPVHHHNHTSIASDVILEEDETEDLEESIQPPEQEVPSDSQSKEENKTKVNSPNKDLVDEAKSQESDSEKSERIDGSEKNKMTTKSNLIHLLESDSESFQIEHGDLIPGNDDTDFDFSFHEK